MNIRQIAQHVHLSKSAVSAALRDHPSIPLETRMRVKTAAHQLHYYPNPKVSMVMSAIAKHSVGRISAPIALLSMWPVKRIWREPLASLGRYYNGCVARAEELGYTVEEFWLEAPGMTPKRMQSILSARGIEAVFVFCYPQAPAKLELDLKPYASVVLGRALVSPRSFSVDHDHHQGLLLALEEVAKRGYRRPTLVISRDAHERTMHCWAAAYQFSMSLRPRNERIPLSIIEANSWRGFDRWFKLHRPDVLLVNDDRLLRQLQTEKAKLLSKVGMVSLFLTDKTGEIAGVDTQNEVQGAMAIELLAEQLRNNRRGLPNTPTTTLLDGLWQDGASLPFVS